jgi:hypothetical protein
VNLNLYEHSTMKFTYDLSFLDFSSGSLFYNS